jgi:hypothetical protein
MTGLKRFIRPSLLISAVAHVGILATGLFFISTKSYETVPPDAMVVEIVTPKEPPRLSGTPSELSTSGSEGPAGYNQASPAGRPSPKEPAPARRAQPASSESGQAETAQLGKELPEAARAETMQAEFARLKQPEPQPSTEETPDQQETAEQIAQLALAGGPLGGGFQAPPVDADRRGIDFTKLFRERVSSCSTLPSNIAPTERVSVVLRVFFNRDGTLASPPLPLEPIVSTKQQALMENSISALQKCQPYTMLPRDKYKLWKQVDLTFYPMNFFNE